MMGNQEDLICYCFQKSRRDIEDDYHKNGRSTIMEEIMAASRKGDCSCHEKNPAGR